VYHCVELNVWQGGQGQEGENVGRAQESDGTSVGMFWSLGVMPVWHCRILPSLQLLCISIRSIFLSYSADINCPELQFPTNPPLDPNIPQFTARAV
jgi:hypothetical protein